MYTEIHGVIPIRGANETQQTLCVQLQDTAHSPSQVPLSSPK